MTGDRLGGEDVDQRADRAARAEIGLEVVEQRVRCVRAAQEPERRGDDADEERGILGRALRPADLPVAVEQCFAAGVALHQEQGALDDVDAARPFGVDAIAQCDGVADRRDDVTHAAGVDVALEGVELEVEGQPDVDRLDLPGRVAQQLGGALTPPAATGSLHRNRMPIGALDRVVGAVDDGGLGARQQDAGLADIPASSSAPAARRSRRARSAASGDSRLAVSQVRAASAGAPMCAVIVAATSSASATSASGPRVARARCHARAGERSGSVDARARWAARWAARLAP